MAQPAPKLHLVTFRPAASTGYARKAWISHVIETEAERISGVALAVLKELADLVDDTTGWTEASYEKLAARTFFAVKTVRNAVKRLKEVGLIEPELIRGEGRDRLRYHFPNMHAFLAERRARHNGGRSNHGTGTSDAGTRGKLTLVSEGENPAPLKNQESEPSARAPAREGLNLDRVLERLGRVGLPKLLTDAVNASAPELHDRTLVLWMPGGATETMLRGAQAMLQMALGMDVSLKRASERRPRAGA
jgi:DNA-binding transcriptional ArsR family regulator